jgi:hypothetical protein
VTANQIGSQCGQLTVLSVCRAAFDSYVAALRISRFVEPSLYRADLNIIKAIAA